MMKQYTARGFRHFLEMADSHGQSVRVTQSSEIGEPRCWVFVGKRPGNDDAYLTVEQAHRLTNALLAFVQEAREGSLP